MISWMLFIVLREVIGYVRVCLGDRGYMQIKSWRVLIQQCDVVICFIFRGSLFFVYLNWFQLSVILLFGLSWVFEVVFFLVFQDCSKNILQSVNENRRVECYIKLFYYFIGCVFRSDVKIFWFLNGCVLIIFYVQYVFFVNVLLFNFQFVI